jgi:predicted nucleic acid-binding protein
VGGKPYVIDTSVLTRWYLGQVGFEAARKFRDENLAGNIDLQTVECARFEMPHVLRKHGLLLGYLTRDQYLAASRTVDDLGIPVAAMGVDDIEACAALSADRNIAFFDAVFVQRALITGAALLTADKGQAQAALGLQIEVALIGAGTP